MNKLNKILLLSAIAGIAFILTKRQNRSTGVQAFPVADDNLRPVTTVISPESTATAETVVNGQFDLSDDEQLDFVIDSPSF